MAKLIYSTLCSLDLFIADAAGKFDWAVPDNEVHRAVNDQERSIGTYLYGRRIYEVMKVWQDWDVSGEPDPVIDYKAIWRDADKLVFSTTLTAVETPRTALRPRFDPEEIRALKTTATRDLGLGGATLAASALRAGLVDEVNLLLSPVLIGSGTPAFPDDIRLDLTLTSERRFGNGVVYLRYAVA